MIVNELSTEQALHACQLHGKVPLSTVYFRVQMTRERGTYSNAFLRRSAARNINILIDITDDDSRIVSPVTMETLPSTCSSVAVSSSQQEMQQSASHLHLQLQSTRKKSRLSPKQASVARLEAKRLKLDYDARYKTAFKDATNLVAGGNSREPVNSICKRLNAGFNLDQKRLTRSTVYQAVRDGRAGTSPQKKGPPPKIPASLLEVVVTHAQVCQVGDGELKGRDLKRLIGASIVGTEHEAAFKVETVYRKVRNEYPHALQAANKISVDDARAQWTTHDNLNQWFDDVKKDLIATGLVDNEAVLDKEGQLVSEVCLKKDTQRRIINMDETHHNLAITGDRGGSRSVSYHNAAFQRGAARGVKSGRHVTGVYATNAEGEALPPFYIFDSTAKSDATSASRWIGLWGFLQSKGGLAVQLV